MKIIISTAVVVCAATWNGSAIARQAELLSFGPRADEFLLIQPARSHRQAPNSPPGEDSMHAVLTRQSPAIVSPGVTSRDPALLRLPDWMRHSDNDLGGKLAPASMSGCRREYVPHPRLNAQQELRRRRYYKDMTDAACRAGVPIMLFDALIIQESRYDPTALSSKGASGLTQLMPATARAMGTFNTWNVAQNLLGGAKYLRKQLDAFGNWALALSAYNAGPGNVLKYKGIPPFRETRGYVRSIIGSMSWELTPTAANLVPTARPFRSASVSVFSP